MDFAPRNPENARDATLLLDGEAGMNPLDSITGTIISGIVLALILTVVIKAVAGI